MNEDHGDYAYQIESEAEYNEVAADLASELISENSPEQIALIAAQHIIYVDTLRASMETGRKEVALLTEILEKTDVANQHKGKRLKLLVAMCKELFAQLQKLKPPAGPQLQRTKKQLVRSVISQIEQWHSAQQSEFDRWDMPGDAGDLLWLMNRLHPKKFGDMEINTFRPHYNGVCRWGNGAGSQPGARSLYIEIFPELRVNPASVVQTRK